MKIPPALADEPAPPPGPAVLAMGFRPFFLAAAAFGVAVVPLWLVLLQRGEGGGGLPPQWWHAHEMLVGYTGAVLAGFLLTAVRRWSGGRPTAANGPLALLVALWLGGRVAHAPGVDLGGAAAWLDAGWLVGTAIAIGRPLWASRRRRNYGFVAALLALAAGSVGLHLAPGLARSSALELLLWVVLVVLAVVGARIIPLFTANVVGGQARTFALVERAMPVALAASLVLAVTRAPMEAQSIAHAITGTFLIARVAGWQPRLTRNAPLLWILHVGYVSLGGGVVLLAASRLGVIPATAATHALTTGAIGALSLGMITRVSLGHTGRALVVGPVMTTAFVLMLTAGIARVVAGLTGSLGGLLTVSGVAWSAALLLWLLTFSRALLTPRPDGKPG